MVTKLLTLHSIVRFSDKSGMRAQFMVDLARVGKTPARARDAERVIMTCLSR